MEQQKKFIHTYKQGRPYFILIKKYQLSNLKNFYNQSYQQAVAALNIIFYLLFKI